MLKSSLIAAVFAMGFSGASYAKTCNLTIEGNDAMQYSTKELTIDSDCKNVSLTLKHSGKLPAAAMGHNWVLTKSADMQAVVAAGIKAGLASNYVPKGDAKVIAATKLIGGGQSDTVTFSVEKLQQGGDYAFFCSFPGHSAMMSGKFVIKKPAA